MKKAIFWDFDGTITYSTPLWTSSVLKAVGKYAMQYGITFENIRPHMAYGFPHHEWNSEYVLQGDTWWEYMFRKFSLLYQSFGLDEDKAGMASKEVRNNILDPESYNVYEDAAITLEASIGKGYKNYILSNNYPELESTIEKLNLSKYFKGYVVSGMVGYNKPRQEIFKNALELANYPDLSFMIGDNPQADIEGGLTAGMKTILVHNSIESRADCTSINLIDVIDFLGKDLS